MNYAGFPVLGELDPALLERVLAHCRIAAYREQDIILHRGAVNEDLHFVLSGRVQVHFDMSDRSDPIEIGAGQMFGEMSVIDQLPVSAFVIAAEPCRLLLLSGRVFWSEVVTVPGVARSVMRALSGLVRRDSVALMRAMRDRLRHAALERELLLARDIQMGMLKRGTLFPDREEFAISAHIEPAKHVGGDFYEAFLLDPDHLVLAIGDVSGKGISASLFMVRALTLLRSSAVNWVSLAKTLDDVNRMLAADNEASMFVTLFMAVLDLRTGALEYVNHSHPPPLPLAGRVGRVPGRGVRHPVRHIRGRRGRGGAVAAAARIDAAAVFRRRDRSDGSGQSPAWSAGIARCRGGGEHA